MFGWLHDESRLVDKDTRASAKVAPKLLNYSERRTPGHTGDFLRSSDNTYNAFFGFGI